MRQTEVKRVAPFISIDLQKKNLSVQNNSIS